MKNIVLAATLIGILSGCAADRAARNLATQLDRDIVTYEQAVDLKVGAEKAFYHAQIDRMREVLGGSTFSIEKVKGEEGKPDEFKLAKGIKGSVPYGRIVSSARRDALAAASKILTADKPDPRTVMTEYLDKGLREDDAAILGAIARQRELAETLEKNLRPINQQKAGIEEVRKGAQTLAKPPSAVDQVKDVASFGKAVADELKKNQ